MRSITLIPGDGIGPEVSAAAKAVIDEACPGLEWETVSAGEQARQQTGQLIPDQVLQSIDRNRIALKGPLATPIGSGHPSLNVMLRQKYDLYINRRPVRSLIPVNGRYERVDLVIFRENTEDLYKGIEEKISDDEAHAVKVVTRQAGRRIAEAAFDYAWNSGRRTVTVAHKANIMKLTDGLFLQSAREIAVKYPYISLKEMIVDNMCMQLVLNPEQFEVILAGNLYGDLLSDLAAGLVGGLGLVPSANIGRNCAIFEAVHGTAPDLAGKNMANPTAMILSGAMMLDYLGMDEEAGLIRSAISQILVHKKYLTPDLGGSATTDEFTNHVITAVHSLKSG
ncbi:MAG: NAD-dependent isocitrate dehydrogenase [Candidatus Delongbacteria bacterium]|nr:NAD-dependent isocitrate dehydrogenase [Candidatus Delongbacteria bacterium]